MFRAFLAMSCASLVGCMTFPVTPPEHRAAVSDDYADRVTVGRVQKEIRIGMSGAQVAAVLGSPNIVTTDEQHREVWIYDRFATETVYSTSRGGIGALVLGTTGNATGGGVAGYSQGAGASSVSQRTFTVIVKYDKESRVRDFAYRTARF